MGYADLHIHTIHSHDGTATVPAVLKRVADFTDLDVIAIADHNSMDGVEEALALAPAYGVEVIPACEISTAQGHLLTLFINRPVKAGLSYLESILAVKEQGGLCIAVHPTAHGAPSVSFEVLHDVLLRQEVQGVLVGVEAFNAGLVYTRRNASVSEKCACLPLAQVGNSDAHMLKMIGHGSTQFPGYTASELRLALERRETAPRCGSHMGGMEVIRDYIPRFLLRRLGWAAWNAAPEKPLSMIRLSRAMAMQQQYAAR